MNIFRGSLISKGFVSLFLVAGLFLISNSAFAADVYVDGSVAGPGTGISSDPFNDIQVAIDSATTTDGDVIHIADGTYVITSTIEVTKELSFVGASQAGTIINGAAASGAFGPFAIHSSKSNLSFSNFTLIGPSGTGRGFKLEGTTANTPSTQDGARASNINFSDITVKQSGRTGIDLNGVNNATLNNVTLNNNGGNGFSLTDGDNLTLTNVTTFANAWGGIAIYTKGQYFPGGVTGVTVSGLNSSEVNPFYVQTEGNDPLNPGFPFQASSISIPQFQYTGTNNLNPVSSGYTFYNDDPFELLTVTTSVGDLPHVTLIDTVASSTLIIGGQDIQTAINNATSGDVIILDGIYLVNTTINVNKSVTLQGVNGAKILTSGTNQLFLITSPEVTITDLVITKTDKSGTQNIIGIQAASTTISNNTFKGKYVIGDGDVSRAMVVSPGVVGFNIHDNHITDLRQPAYIDASTGVVTNNFVGGTRGWVVLSDANVTFTGNTWGTNVLDIAIIPGASNNYTDIISMSAANNNANIENQFGTPTLNHVYVDGSVAVTGNGTLLSPYKTISEAFSRVATSGVVTVAAATYTENLSINKSLSLQGSNIGVTGSSTSRGAETVINGNGVNAAVQVNANDVTVDGFTIRGGAGTYLSGVYSAITNTNLIVRNNIITDNAIGVYAECATCTIENNLFDANNRPGSAGGAGIYTEKSTDLSILNNEFRGHLNNSAVIFAAVATSSHTNVVFTGNNIHDNNSSNSMVYVVGVTGGAFNSNTISQSGSNAFSFSNGNENISLTSNTLLNSGRGIKISNGGDMVATSSNFTVLHNIFASNTIAAIEVVDGFDGDVNAINNYWGHPTGPNAPLNLAGLGDIIIGAVLYTPWCVNETCTTPVVVPPTPTPTPTTGGGLLFFPNQPIAQTGQVLGATTGQVLGASSFRFNMNLRYGMRNDDVTELHKFLIANGYLKISAPTGWYGPLTRAAVIKWQAANGIPATGFFGPLSRAFINQ